VVNREELDHMQEDIARILSNLEMFFPPSFFDVMVHLTVHLVDEIKYCGPVFLRNMYPFERFMGILKRYCQNRCHPKASVLQGYTADEVVEFCTEYMKQRPIGLPLSQHEGRLAGKPVLAGALHAAPEDVTIDAHMAAVNRRFVLVLSGRSPGSTANEIIRSSIAGQRRGCGIRRPPPPMMSLIWPAKG
jgi:hypothetical protein